MKTLQDYTNRDVHGIQFAVTILCATPFPVRMKFVKSPCVSRRICVPRDRLYSRATTKPPPRTSPKRGMGGLLVR